MTVWLVEVTFNLAVDPHTFLNAYRALNTRGDAEHRAHALEAFQVGAGFHL
jgi:hypothetical protein